MLGTPTVILSRHVTHPYRGVTHVTCDGAPSEHGPSPTLPMASQKGSDVVEVSSEADMCAMPELIGAGVVGTAHRLDQAQLSPRRA